jgi:hypothetical protein
MILFKKQIFDIEVKGQGPTTKKNMVRTSFAEKKQKQKKRKEKSD